MSNSYDFTAIGSGPTFTLPVLTGSNIVEAGPSLPFTYTVSGTFVATLILEVTQNNGETWTTLVTTTTTVSSTTSYGPGTFRWRCTAFTSGTATATITSSVYNVQTWKNSEQATVFTITSNGPNLGPIAPTSVAATGTITGSNLIRGAGSPEGAVTASVGSIYERTDGSTGTSVYAKESGAGNTGWSALATGAVSGSGTTGKVPLWSSSSALGNSVVSQSSSIVKIEGSSPTVAPIAGEIVAGNGQIRVAGTTRGPALRGGDSLVAHAVTDTFAFIGANVAYDGLVYTSYESGYGFALKMDISTGEFGIWTSPSTTAPTSSLAKQLEFNSDGKTIIWGSAPGTPAANSVRIGNGMISIPIDNTQPGVKIGSEELHCHEFNNSWISDNLYYQDGGPAWTYRATGFGTVFRVGSSGDMIFGTAPSGTGGTSATVTTQLTIANTGAATFAGTINAPTPSSSLGSLVLPHGAAPTGGALVDGTIWTTSAGMFVRINGVTKTVTLV